jgi:Na+-transporting methylmalonyl-CoA/oxaloacetate decarboxylase gamma subunit
MIQGVIVLEWIEQLLSRIGIGYVMTSLLGGLFSSIGFVSILLGSLIVGVALILLGLLFLVICMRMHNVAQQVAQQTSQAQLSQMGQAQSPQQSSGHVSTPIVIAYPPTAPTPNIGIRCPNCGRIIPPDSNYCNICGEYVRGADVKPA